jgi:hypothetical protein
MSQSGLALSVSGLCLAGMNPLSERLVIGVPACGGVAEGVSLG